MTLGLKEVAEKAGVSVSTVSRYVAGHRVRPAARAAVEAAIGLTGYQPNLAARRLKNQSSGTLGVVLPDLANPFFQQLAEALENEAWRGGRRIILCNSNEDAAREERYLDLLMQERVDAVIVAPVSARLVNKLPVDPRFVLIDRVPASSRFDTVTMDHAAASVALVTALYASGHRRIVGLFTRAPIVGAARRRGYLRGVAEHDIVSLELKVGHGRAAFDAAVNEAFERWPDCDAIIAGNSPVMLATGAALVKRRHPATLAGFDRADWLTLLDRPTIWVEQPIQGMAHAMMEMVEASPADPPRKAVFQGSIRSSN